MSKLYRVTPKNNKWIIQKIDDRSTVSAKPFIKKTDAENAMYAMIASEGKQVTSTTKILTNTKKARNSSSITILQLNIG